MSIQKLPSGRYRAQVYDSSTGKLLSVSKVLGGPGTFRTRTEAKAAREEARTRLRRGMSGVTVAEFQRRWTTDPLFARPKESTNIHNRERTGAFVQRYGSLALDHVSDAVVAEWLAGGKRNGTVPALRAMFNDAMSAKAGRLLERNPFAGLGLKRTKGNRDRKPPTQEGMERLVALARELTPPSFAAYLEFAMVEGPRPSELDALRWERIRWEEGEVDVVEQWNAKTRTFTEPKYGPYTIALVGRGRDVLMRMKRDRSESPFVFTTLRGTHYTATSRIHHWNRVRAAAGLGGTTLYLATRHYWGWYALNVLELEPHVIAEQLGHRDGGKLVVQLYGHPDKARARRKIREAHDQADRAAQLRLIRGDAA
jgi:integrase